MYLEQAINIKCCNLDATTEEKLTHSEIYPRAINALGGLNIIISYIPWSRKVIKQALSEDEHLNNLPLRTWDSAVGIMCPHSYLDTALDERIRKSGHQLINLCRDKRISISASQGVCILKEAARQWAEKEGIKK